jgi:DNA-binding response OmpR family regulator
MRVLVVEDSRTLADALADGLRDEGFTVDVAYDGMQAATKLDLAGYHVIVLDRDLPGLHGDTVCRMITERDAPSMVLMLTASGDPGQRVSGLRLGADDYLSKPFHSRPAPGRAAARVPRGGHRAQPPAPHRHPTRAAAGPLEQGVCRA